jgi:phosphopantothenoylcysteine decarboxylase/phosphopantothenate--cysteine ligase
VTAGPTREAIDPVRYISNHSTGQMGYAVAAELAARGAEVTLVSGPVALETPPGVRRVDVVSAADMWSECEALWPGMDGAVMCAAVADYTPAEVSTVKIKKAATGHLTINLVPTKDIAAELGRTKRREQVLVGFALETDNERDNALRKLARKNLDLIVLNSLRDPGAGFGHDTNRITIFSGGNAHSGGNANCGESAHSDIISTSYPLESKQAAAVHIVDAINSAYGFI